MNGMSSSMHSRGHSRYGAGPGPAERDGDELDDVLIVRLRDLALVDLDALLAGTSGDRYAELLTAHAEDLCHALDQARARTRELVAVVARGSDPMALLDAPYQSRARDGGREAARRVDQRLTARAAACRALARLDDVAGPLFPMLLEADRRLASLGTKH